MEEVSIEYEPRLVEEAVAHALRGRVEQAGFRAARDPLYAIADPEEREAAFRALHAAWFKRLDLAGRIDESLQEQPSVAAGVARCLVAYAPSGRDEGAELFVSAEPGVAEGVRRVVVIRLQPETLTLPDRVRALLRREFLHIVDMLDPRFGYEPRLRPSAPGPAPAQLVRGRYRVLWDAYVDGRLARSGWVPPGVRGERLRDFARAFAMLGERAEEAFERFFGGTDLTHAELVAFARDPEGALPRRSGPCGL